MEMRVFFRALLRWWFLPVVCVIVAVLGVWAYHRITDKAEAAATVAILQSYVPPPGEYLPPQIGFDALGESDELSRRIAERLNDGTTAEQVRGWLSIDVKTNLNARSQSLLYTVSIEHDDEQYAIRVANIAVEEAQTLFAEINTPDSRDVRDAFDPEIKEASANVDQARAALVQFEDENDAYALTERRDQKLGTVSQLRMALIAPSASSTAGATSSLTAARSELNRLLALEPEYERLDFNVGLAQAAVGQLKTRVADLEAAGPSAAGQLAETRSQLDEAQAEFERSLVALGDYQSANSVSQVPGAIQSQLALVNQLTIADATSKSNASAVQSALAQEQAELDRLSSLEPEYNKLNLELQKAEGQLSSLQQRVLDVIASRTLPATAQAKLLQPATLQTSLVWTVLTYGLGVFLAVFVSVSCVYLLAYFQRVPPTIDEIEKALGTPVLGHIARATR